MKTKVDWKAQNIVYYRLVKKAGKLFEGHVTMCTTSSKMAAQLTMAKTMSKETRQTSEIVRVFEGHVPPSCVMSHRTS